MLCARVVSGGFSWAVQAMFLLFTDFPFGFVFFPELLSFTISIRLLEVHLKFFSLYGLSLVALSLLLHCSNMLLWWSLSLRLVFYLTFIPISVPNFHCQLCLFFVRFLTVIEPTYNNLLACILFLIRVSTFLVNLCEFQIPIGRLIAADVSAICFHLVSFRISVFFYVGLSSWFP